VENSVEKIAIYPDVTRQCECFSGLHQGRATDNRQVRRGQTSGLYCSQEVEGVPTRATFVAATFIIAHHRCNGHESAQPKQNMNTRRIRDGMNDAGSIGPETAQSH
jgi:hypothetical protein